METILEEWKNKSDKEMQNRLQIINGKIIKCKLLDVKDDIDVLLELINSNDISFNNKLRLGVSVFLSVAVFNYPYSISELYSSNQNFLIIILNGIIDYQTCFDNESLFKDSKFLNLPYSKLDLFYSLLPKILDNDFKQYYHLILLIKKAWQITEKASNSNLFSVDFHMIEKIVRVFVPLLDSSITGLTVLISELFQSVIKWAILNRSISQTAISICELSIEILNEFFPFSLEHSKASYPLCKINLRFLKIVIQSFGIDFTLEKLPFLFDYLLQTIAINHTATISGDIFSAALKQTGIFLKKENLEIIMEKVENFMIYGCNESWFECSSKELQCLNYAVFVIPSCVKHCYDTMITINEKIQEILLESQHNELRDHRLFMWITSFAIIYPENKIINEEQAGIINHCLWHSKDHIRIASYKFVCDNYSQQINQLPFINLSNIIDVFVNNLTSDSPGFRNHMISATRRLFICIRDSTVSYLSESECLLGSISTLNKKLSHLFNDRVVHLESIHWVEEMKNVGNSLHQDIALLIIFSRLVYGNQWMYTSLNYQRQRSIIDLVTIIREVLIDSNFIIDKKCGFANKTVIGLRNFYRIAREAYFSDNKNIIQNLINAIKVSKVDVQNSLFSVLKSTYNDFVGVRNELNLNDLWKETQILCHSSQPIQLNAGALFCCFLSFCDYHTDSSITIDEHLVDFLEHLASIDMSSVLTMSLKTPGYGFLMSIDLLLKQNLRKSILHSERIPLAALKVVKLMMQTMGCEDHDLASFHKMGITMNSVVNKDDVNQSIRLNIEYQHVLSWTWQVMKNTTSILVAWCQVVVKEIRSPLFREIGVILLKILCQSRHRGTIECVSGYLQTYIQLGKGNGYPNNWLTANEVAINECIEGAARGKYSITRRSAGLPLILMSALNGANDNSTGSGLASECLIQLMDLCYKLDNDTNDTNGWCDPPIVHYLNLMKQMCSNPALQVPLQRHFGKIILITLQQFSSSNWGVRNAALQLFMAMLSRVASATKGLASNPTFSEVFSLYPELWNPIVNIIKSSGLNDSKSFVRNQTLVPTLTFLSNLLYSTDKQLPQGMSLSDLLSCFWPLLTSRVVVVRHLAAKCIINSLPNSSFAFDIIQSNTYLIPQLNKPAGNWSNISHNQQQGELFLLNLVLEKIQFHFSLSIETLIEYGKILKKKQCWILLDSLVLIFIKIDIPHSYRLDVRSFFEETFEGILNSSSIGIGRLNVLISIIKLIATISTDSRIMGKTFSNANHADVLQRIIFDFDTHTKINMIVSEIFAEDIELLLESIYYSLIDYRAHYTPYVIQIFCHVLNSQSNLSIPKQYPIIKLIELLHKFTSIEISEAVLVSCQQILNWLFCKIDIDLEEIYHSHWMNHIEQSIDCQSLESTRMSAAKNIDSILNSLFFDKLIFKFSNRFAVVITFGCYDECKSIRDIFRAILNKMISQHNDSDSHLLRQSDLINFYRVLSEKSIFSKKSIMINVLSVIIRNEKEFFHYVRQNKIKDVLYEPVSGNIFIEFSMILEVIYRELKNEVLTEHEVFGLLELLPKDLSDDEIITNSTGSFLYWAEHFLKNL